MAEEEACINTFVNTVSLHNLYHFSHNFSKKIDIIRNVIIPIAAILKKKCPPFFCNITNSTTYDFAKFHVKTFSYQDLRRGEGHNQTKIPRGRQG